MIYIENEFAFKRYMETNSSPPSPISRSSYISNLRFLSTHNFNIDRNLDTTENIIESLRRRDIPTNTKLADYGSALNMYRKFLNTNDVLLVNDLEDINADTDLSKTEKLTLIKARVGQGKFRDEVIELWKKCAVMAQ